MRHQKSGKKLNRDSSARKALFRSQTTSLLKHEHIVTTLAKAQGVRGFAENMITLGKKGSLHHRRQALEWVLEVDVVDKVFDELAARYKERAGGYTLMIKLGPRKGDGAETVKLELV